MASVAMSASPVMVVTGASDGVGAALVKRFAGAFTVCALARREEKLKEVAAASAKPDAVAIFPVDVSDRNAVVSTCKKILDQFGKVDVLV